MVVEQSSCFCNLCLIWTQKHDIERVNYGSDWPQKKSKPHIKPKYTGNAGSIFVLKKTRVCAEL